jgi:hypothetical protein
METKVSTISVDRGTDAPVITDKRRLAATLKQRISTMVHWHGLTESERDECEAAIADMIEDLGPIDRVDAVPISFLITQQLEIKQQWRLREAVVTSNLKAAVQHNLEQLGYDDAEALAARYARGDPEVRAQIKQLFVSAGIDDARLRSDAEILNLGTIDMIDQRIANLRDRWNKTIRAYYGRHEAEHRRVVLAQMAAEAKWRGRNMAAQTSAAAVEAPGT